MTTEDKVMTCMFQNMIGAQVSFALLTSLMSDFHWKSMNNLL